MHDVSQQSSCASSEHVLSWLLSSVAKLMLNYLLIVIFLHLENLI